MNGTIRVLARVSVIGVFFLSAFAAQADRLTLSGYVGIGVTIRQIRAEYSIEALKAGGPAERYGVKVGDWLLAVDGRGVNGLNIDQVTSMLKGSGTIGSLVSLTLVSPDRQSTRTIDVPREWIEVECFAEGWVNLRYFGNGNYGNIDGYVGNDSIHLDVSFNQARGYFKGEFINLNVDQQFDWTLSGFIRNTYVSWRGFNGSWNFFQSCIP